MKLLSLVKDYKNVTIFRHQIADHDAMGAQFGLKEYLQSAYPEKNVYAIGESVGTCAKLYPAIDIVSDEVVADSIAFVLDSANRNRIDDSRFLNAKKIIKIDHHIVVDEYADESYVDTSAAATCEILTFMFNEEGGFISPTCAKYLYYGLIADSISFTTANTTANTLLAGSILVKCGVDVRNVRSETTGMSKEEFYYINEIRSNAKVYGKVVYSIMDEETYKKYGLTYNQAKEKVYALADVYDFEIWCLFSQDGELYNGSLRSRKAAINTVANNYNGGGHKNACGVKRLTLEMITSLVHDLNECCKEEM